MRNKFEQSPSDIDSPDVPDGGIEDLSMDAAQRAPATAPGQAAANDGGAPIKASSTPTQARFAGKFGSGHGIAAHQGPSHRGKRHKH